MTIDKDFRHNFDNLQTSKGEKDPPMQLLERIYAKQNSLIRQLAARVLDQLNQLATFQDATQEMFRPTVDSLLQEILTQMNVTFADANIVRCLSM